MKLYSHSQLIKCTILSVVAAVLLTVAICVNISKKNNTNTDKNTDVTEVVNQDEGLAAEQTVPDAVEKQSGKQ